MRHAELKRRLHRLERDYGGGEVVRVMYGDLAGEHLRDGFKPDTLKLAFELHRQPDGHWLKTRVGVPW